MLYSNTCGEGKRLSRWSHKPEIVGSTPTPATMGDVLKFDRGWQITISMLEII